MEGVEMDVFASGSLMSEIFRRYSIFVSFSLVFIACYESWRFWKVDRRATELILPAIAFVSGALFAWYYSPAIIALQIEGLEATQSLAFDSLHSQSVVVFKIFAVSNGALAIYRALLRLKGRRADGKYDV
jgi:hypothetical protein